VTRTSVSIVAVFMLLSPVAASWVPTGGFLKNVVSS
jgi:hypothetical protein